MKYSFIVTGSLPIIRVREGYTTVIQIPAADWDLTDSVRCRWASGAGAAGNECGDICQNLPNANLSNRSVIFPMIHVIRCIFSNSDCTITWTAVRRPYDISTSRLTSTYVLAIMVEDFANSISIIPMSSVPLQM